MSDVEFKLEKSPEPFISFVPAKGYRLVVKNIDVSVDEKSKTVIVQGKAVQETT